MDKLFNIMVLATAITSFVTSTDTESNSSGSDHLILENDYKKNQPPVPPNSSLSLHIEIYIWSIPEISAKNMEMTVDTFVEFTWIDYRVKPSPVIQNTTERIPLSGQAALLWTPIVHFRNCRGCGPLLFDPKKQNLYYDPVKNTLWTSIRSFTKFSCTILLQAYPMDKQMCRIQLESYFDELKNIQFDHGFDYKHQRISSNESLAEFEFDNITVGDCIVPTYDSKLYGCIELKVHFYRRLGYYMTTIYAPTMCIVVLSWISFWIPASVEAARVALGVTSLLTLATRLDQTQNNLPAVSYIKAIDAWMFSCIFLVFASLIEFSISNYTWRIRDETKSNAVHPQLITTGIAVAAAGSPSAVKRTKEETKTKKIAFALFPKEKKATRLDKISRLAFPATFLFFNIVYWSYYMSYYE